MRYEIFGDGPEKANLERLTNDLGLADCVSFLGHRSREKILEALQHAHVFVMVSLHETFGLTLPGSRSEGLYSLRRAKLGVDGIAKDGENGFLCWPGDVEGLAEVLQRILTVSAQQLEGIALAVSATIQGLTEERVANDYRTAIEGAVIETHGGRR